jgi:hypothetical protein
MLAICVLNLDRGICKQRMAPKNFNMTKLGVRMQSLVIQPTSTAQWQALVNEAEQACALELGEELESYLVFLLMRFCRKPEVIRSILSLDFLNSLRQFGHYRNDLLQEVGDKCLLFSGLFPGLATKKRVNEDYFIDLGQNAYYEVATLSDEELTARLFNLLSEHFGHLRKVLVKMREPPGSQPSFLVDYIQKIKCH